MVARLSRYAQWLGRHGGSLKVQVFRGALWLFFSHGLARVASLIKLVVLARLLTPAEFGLVGIAMLLVSRFEQLSQIGFRQALVRTSGDIWPYLDTLWTVQVVRGVVLLGVLLAVAPLAAWFFDRVEVQPVMRALAPLVFLRSLINPATVYLARDLDFRRLAGWQACQVMTGLLVAIPLAMWYRNVWALIWPLLIGQVVHTLVSYRLHPYRPRFAFNYQLAGEMANFGKWIFWKNVLHALIGSVDGVAVGKLVGTSALGLYQVAMRLATLPSHILIQVLPPVTFPAFAKLEQPQQWRQAYLQIVELVLLLAIPVATVVCVFPHLIVQVVLGEQWLTIVPLLQLLAICGSLQVLLDIARPMFEAVGRPDLQVKLQGAEAVVAVVLISTLALYGGLIGAAIAVVMVHVVLLGMQVAMLRAFMGLGVLEGLATLRQGSLAALPIAGFGLLNVLSRLYAAIDIGPAMEIGLGCLAMGVCIVLLWRFLPRHISLR